MGMRTGSDPGTIYKAITGSDTADNGKFQVDANTSVRFRAIRVDVAGTIIYTDLNGNTTTINGVAGEIIPGEFLRIGASSTATVHGLA